MKKQSKFNVGDLVMMSAAGNKVQQNSHLQGGWGIITWIFKKQSDDVDIQYPIKVQWYGSSKQQTARFKPYELKFFKKNT